MLWLCYAALQGEIVHIVSSDRRVRLMEDTDIDSKDLDLGSYFHN